MGGKRVSLMKLVNRAVPDRFFLSRCNGVDSRVYLTFDDGPHPVWTRRSMDTLDEIGVKATYFLVGREAERHADVVQEVVRRGHGVGNHTYSHRAVVGLNRKDLDAEVVENGKRLSDLSGQEVKMFRPPWGRLDMRSAVYIVIKGQQIVMWSVDSTDYKCEGSRNIVERLDEVGVTAGDITLFHDDNEHTIASLPEIVEKIHRKGLFVSKL